MRRMRAVYSGVEDAETRLATTGDGLCVGSRTSETA